MGSPELPRLLKFAGELADLARPIAKAHFRSLTSVDAKADRTPVTAADRAIERALRERIAAAFPAHGVFGEEEGPDRPDAEWLWVLDPIDGTKAFATGNPLFGTLIGLMHRGVPVVGVLDAPALGERWSAAQGLGAFHDGARIHTRPERLLEDAVLYCTTPDPLLGHEGHRRLRGAAQWTSYGADCLAYAFVAMGGADLVVDRGLQPYDWCALVPLLTEAGGVLTDWRGAPLHLGSDGSAIAASGPALLAAARACLGDAT
ncbi:MAG: inositol monophosphatase family protein [Planctomycetes bacterium]|nr:inositol monophosphatase family protein [Planctomycetota bacterium]MCB9884864.1 inositol monophosphatase family protein [Planctomycetota bacterium]